MLKLYLYLFIFVSTKSFASEVSTDSNVELNFKRICLSLKLKEEHENTILVESFKIGKENVDSDFNSLHTMPLHLGLACIDKIQANHYSKFKKNLVEKVNKFYKSKIKDSFEIKKAVHYWHMKEQKSHPSIVFLLDDATTLKMKELNNILSIALNDFNIQHLCNYEMEYAYLSENYIPHITIINGWYIESIDILKFNNALNLYSKHFEYKKFQFRLPKYKF